MKGMILSCVNSLDNIRIFEYLGYSKLTTSSGSRYIVKDIGSDYYTITDSIPVDVEIIESLRDPENLIVLNLLILDSGTYFFKVQEDIGNYKTGKIYRNLDFRSDIMPKYYEEVVDIDEVIKYIQNEKFW